MNPNQNIKITIAKYEQNSFKFKSIGTERLTCNDSPKRAFTQLRKKKVGAKKYNNINKNIQSIGKRSKKKVKKRNSEMKKIEPGKPKKIKQFNKQNKKSLGHKKFIPLSSVIKRVLNLRLMESTNKNAFVESKA